MQIIAKRILMQGFVVGDANFGPKYGKDHQQKVSAWLADGSVKAKLHETRGIEKAAEGFVGMLNGENFGKAVLIIKDE